MWMSCRKWMCYQKQSHRSPGAFEPVATLDVRPSRVPIAPVLGPLTPPKQSTSRLSSPAWVHLLPRRRGTQDSARTTPPGGSSLNTLQSWDVPADNGASTHRHASSNPAPEPQRRAATLSCNLSSSTPTFECTANSASSDASRDRAQRSLPTNRMSFFRHGMIAD
jgi:hypothetical protein